jgi:hypothetical protein
MVSFLITGLATIFLIVLGILVVFGAIVAVIRGMLGSGDEED